MFEVKFNPWLGKYKQPFGAVSINTSVHFSLEVNTGIVEAVYLVMRKENFAANKIKMSQDTANRYQVAYRIGKEKGLYFYYFQIDYFEDERHKQCYVGRTEGDVTAQLVDDESGLHSYQLTCYDEKLASPDWYKEAVCYQIFPDRFHNDQPEKLPRIRKKDSFLYLNQDDVPMYIKNEANDVVRWDFFGGNLAGILAKVDYLKDLGVNLIYLNPIFAARSNHRYDTADYHLIDDMLGDEDSFKDFIDTLHQNGIRVILDGVFNHVGKNSRYFNYDGSYETLGAYQSQESPYYSWFHFEEYPEGYRSWWGVKDLPETNKENPQFQAFVYGAQDSVIGKWTGLGVDGWRLDVADELPDFFISGIRQRLNQFSDKILIGEVWEDASNKISYDYRRQYILGDSLQGIMNYPLKEAIVQLVKQEKTSEEVTKNLMSLYENYPKAVFYNNLNHLGTHDTERIFSLLEEDMTKLKLAVAMLFCFPGVPCIYYGDEAGLTGGKDPDNRKFFPWGKENRGIHALYKEWVYRRKKYSSLFHGELNFGYTDQLLMIVRSLPEEKTCLILNPTNEEQDIQLSSFTFLRELESEMIEQFAKKFLTVPAREVSFEVF